MCLFNIIMAVFLSISIYFEGAFMLILATHLATQLATQCIFRHFHPLRLLHKKSPVSGAKPWVFFVVNMAA